MRGYISCGACGYEGPNAGPCPECGRIIGNAVVKAKEITPATQTFRCMDVVIGGVKRPALMDAEGPDPFSPEFFFQ